MEEGSTTVSEDEIRDAIRTVVDPEAGLDIVELGLVYGIDVSDDTVVVRMTMTTPTCPMSDYLTGAVVDAVATLVPAAPPVRVEVVFDPPWTPSMMSEFARGQFGWPGS
jgi:metal-sulfur cluster biosynthetic enzyme